jgi:hypothetical protein
LGRNIFKTTSKNLTKVSSNLLDQSKFASINNKNQIRTYLLLHEYISLGLLKDAGINVPKFKVASTTDQVRQITASQGSIFVLFYLFLN